MNVTDKQAFIILCCKIFAVVFGLVSKQKFIKN